MQFFIHILHLCTLCSVFVTTLADGVMVSPREMECMFHLTFNLKYTSRIIISIRNIDHSLWSLGIIKISIASQKVRSDTMYTEQADSDTQNLYCCIIFNHTSWKRGEVK